MNNFEEYKYIIYKITNLDNGHIYIGSHKTKNINDNYYGSGRIICQAIKKYGKEHFRKDVLFVYDNPKQMYDKEKEIVNEQFVKRPDTYNAHIGGRGGWDFVNKNEKELENKREKFRKYIDRYKSKMNKEQLTRYKDYEKNPKMCKKCGKKIPYEKYRNTFCSRICANSHNMTDEVKKKISDAFRMKRHQI